MVCTSARISEDGRSGNGTQVEDATEAGCSSVQIYSKTCLKRNAIVPVFFSPFSQVSVLQRAVF